MRIVKQGIYPSDTGWMFPEPTGGEIRGENFDDLVAKVAEFRAKNKLPEGDPIEEVKSWLCANNLGLCKQKKLFGDTSVPKAPVLGAFGDRVLEWCAAWIEGHRRSVGPDEIRRRAAVCRVCPHNRAWAASCGTCRRRVLRAVDAIIGGYPREAIRGLGACGHFVWENRLACGADITNDAGAPIGCWRRPAG